MNGQPAANQNQNFIVIHHIYGTNQSVSLWDGSPLKFGIDLYCSQRMTPTYCGDRYI